MRVLLSSFFWLFGSAIVFSSSSVARQREPTRINSTLETRIGAVDGPNALGRVEAFEVDPDGNIYILESDEQRVRIFSKDGDPVRTLGRSGSGPGEFRNPVGLTFGPGGNLWVIDPGNARASVYSADGSLVSDRSLVSGFELAPWPGRFDRSGNLYHYSIGWASRDFTYVMVKYDARLQAIDTIVPPQAPESEQYFENTTERWGIVRAGVPFTPRLVWRLGSDGRMWWAWTGGYSVSVGNTTLLTAQRTGPRVTDMERAAALDGLDRFREVGGRVDVSRIPDVKPPMRTFFLDELDRVWVIPERAEAATGLVLEMYETDGLAWEVTIPVELAAYPTPIFRNGRVYGVVRDELDIPFLVALRVVP